MANETQQSSIFDRIFGGLSSITFGAANLLINMGWTAFHYGLTNLSMALFPIGSILFSPIFYLLARAVGNFTGYLVGNGLSTIWPNAVAFLSGTIFSTIYTILNVAALGLVGFTLVQYTMSQFQDKAQKLNEKGQDLLESFIRYGVMNNKAANAENSNDHHVAVVGIDKSYNDSLTNPELAAQARQALRHIAGDRIPSNNVFLSELIKGPSEGDEKSESQLLAHFKEAYREADGVKARKDVLDNAAKYLAQMCLKQNRSAEDLAKALGERHYAQYRPKLVKQRDEALTFIQGQQPKGSMELVQHFSREGGQQGHGLVEFRSQYAMAKTAAEKQAVLDKAIEELNEFTSKTGPVALSLAAQNHMIDMKSQGFFSKPYLFNVILPTLSWIPLILASAAAYNFGLPWFKAAYQYRRWDDARRVFGFAIAGSASLLFFVIGLFKGTGTYQSTEPKYVETWNNDDEVRFMDTPSVPKTPARPSREPASEPTETATASGSRAVMRNLYR